MINLVEKAKRSNATTFEIAVGCERIINQSKIRAAELAKQIGYSLSHVLNLVRLLKTLPPSIIEDWRANNPLLTNKRLELLAHDPEGEKKWLATRNYQTQEELDRQLTKTENHDTENDSTGWTAYKRPTKAAIRRLREVFLRAKLPRTERECRELMVGLCDYYIGARVDVPHITVRPPRKKTLSPPSVLPTNTPFQEEKP